MCESKIFEINVETRLIASLHFITHDLYLINKNAMNPIIPALRVNIYHILSAYS